MATAFDTEIKDRGIRRPSISTETFREMLSHRQIIQRSLTRAITSFEVEVAQWYPVVEVGMRHDQRAALTVVALDRLASLKHVEHMLFALTVASESFYCCSHIPPCSSAAFCD